LTQNTHIYFRSDLKLAMKRIEDLQMAISGELDSDSHSADSNRL